MEKLVTIPGFYYIAGKIFSSLDLDSLLKARAVCTSWKSFLDHDLHLWRILLAKQGKTLGNQWQRLLADFDAKDVKDMIFVLKFLTSLHDKPNEETLPQESLVTNVKVLQLFATQARLDLNKSLDSKGTKIIHLAASKQNQQSIEYLLPLIREKNPLDTRGNSPMLISIQARNWSQIQIFMPVCNCRDFWTRSHGSKGPPILDVIMTKNLKLLQEISKLGVDLNTAYGDMSAYPLHIAVFCRDLKTFQFIYQRVESKNPIDGLNRSVSQLARHLKCVEILNFLQEF